MIVPKETQKCSSINLAKNKGKDESDQTNNNQNCVESKEKSNIDGIVPNIMIVPKETSKCSSMNLGKKKENYESKPFKNKLTKYQSDLYQKLKCE